MNRKKLSLLLALAIFLSTVLGTVPVQAENNFGPLVENKLQMLDENIKTQLNNPENQKLVNLSKDLNLKESNPELEEAFKEQNPEELRVLIEVDKPSVLEVMNTQGNSYEQMSRSAVSNTESRVQSAINYTENAIHSQGLNYEKLSDYSVAFSGFAAKIKTKDLETIKNTPGVKKVYISKKYILEKPTMVTSHEMINDKHLWDELGYKGEGTVIAVIDSGTDIAHKDMRLSEETKPVLTKSKVEELVAQHGLSGKYYSEKVPYGFNYFDGNYTIKDLGPSASEHGMHVAGTITANGDLVKGVAPESQILGMKVFGNDPLWGTTYDDIYLQAIEDAIILGADALNMSLGSTAGFDDLESVMNETITRAVNAGIVCAVAAGNESHIYYGLDRMTGGAVNSFPFAEDYDYGVVGTPSVYEDTISVASIENAKLVYKAMLYGEETTVVEELEDLPKGSVIFSRNDTPNELKAYNFDYIKANHGLLLEYLYAYMDNRVFEKVADDKYVNTRKEEINVKELLPATIIYYDAEGKESERTVWKDDSTVTPTSGMKKKPYLDSVGNMSSLRTVEYVDCGLGTDDEIPAEVDGKLALIQRGEISFGDKVNNAAAKGAIGVLIYNNESGGDQLMSMGGITNHDIPSGFAYHSVGVELAAMEKKLVTFTEELMSVENAIGGQMSDFSSIGPTPTLRMKPELTAPGGGIYSTLNDDRYGTMSGTSMATPHVAGGAALVQQHLKEKYPNMGVQERTRLVKTLLMNTASIVKDGDTPVTVRKQGAGLMNLQAAVTAPAYVTVNNGQPKLELGQRDSNSFSVNYELKSLGKGATYSVRAVALEDVILGNALNSMRQKELTANVTGNVTATLSDTGSVKGSVNVTIPNLKQNSYIDGWLIFEDTKDNNPTLVVPFLGFYGDWDGLRIFDDFKFEENPVSKYGIANFVHKYFDIFSSSLGISIANPKRAISPGTKDGFFSGTENIGPAFTIIRNADKVKATIENEEGRPLRILTEKTGLRKNYTNNGRGRQYYLLDDYIWDGRIKGEVIEGNYTYVLEATPAGGGQPQQKRVSVIVDTTPPEVTDLVLNKFDETITFTATDKGSGVFRFVVTLDKKVPGKEEETIAGTKGLITVENNDPRLTIIDAEKGRYKINISELIPLMKEEDDNLFSVLVLDYAGNAGMGQVDDVVTGQDELTLIYLPNPDLRGITNKNDIEFSGYILKDSKISVAVYDNGVKRDEVINLVYDPAIPILNEKNEPIGTKMGWRFNQTLNLDEGYHMMRFVALDSNGEELDSVQRAILVDTIAPEVEVLSVQLNPDKYTASVTMKVKEQAEYFKVMADGSQVFEYDEYGKFPQPSPIDKEVTFEVINVGPNDKVINFTVFDIAGNKTDLQYQIYEPLPGTIDGVQPGPNVESDDLISVPVVTPEAPEGK